LKKREVALQGLLFFPWETREEFEENNFGQIHRPAFKIGSQTIIPFPQKIDPDGSVNKIHEIIPVSFWKVSLASVENPSRAFVGGMLEVSFARGLLRGKK